MSRNTAGKKRARALHAAADASPDYAAGGASVFLPDAPSGPAPGLQAAQVAPGVRFLDTVQLEELSRCFERWVGSARGPATRRARGRVRQVFLVLRATGARLGETLAIDDRTDIDFDRCAVFFRDGQGARRSVQLPREVAGELRAFAADPWNAALRGGIFAMDQGHVRRKFQEVGALCALPRELCNPTVLRRSRAIELLRGGIPVKIVQNILGVSTSQLLANFLDFSSDEMKTIVEHQILKETSRKTSARNTFFGKVTAIRRGDIQSEVTLATLGGFTVLAVITNGSLKNMGLRTGVCATAIIKAPWVILGKRGAHAPLSAENIFPGVAATVLQGEIMAEVTVALADQTRMCAILTGESLKTLDLKPQDAVDVMFTAASVILLAE